MASVDVQNHAHQPIITVGIIGCSNHSLSKQWVCKQLVSNQITNSVSDENDFLCDPFQWMRGLQSTLQNDECSQKSMLSIHDDIESGTIYFNLKSHSNLEELNKLLSVLCAQSSQYEFHRILQSTESIYIKSLIFIFFSCHHILLFQSTPRFNPQWLSIFRFLQEMKLKLISPIIGILQPLFAHIVPSNESVNKSKDTTKSSNDKENIMNYLSSHNLPPFIIPVLTFLYPAPNTNGSLVLDASYCALIEKDIHSGNGGIVQKAVLRKFTSRLQQQICVLLRRCHAIFPYFQTGFDGTNTPNNANTNKNDLKNSPNKSSSNKYGSYTSLTHCIEELDALGFGVRCYLDEEIYSTHSRWIETDDMMHTNPLSLFCLLPHRFIQIYTEDMMNCIHFLFVYHESLLNDTSLFHRQREDSKMSRVEAWIKSVNNDIASYLKGARDYSKDKNNKAKEKKEQAPKKRCMPTRMLYYISSKQIYDAIFKNFDEIDDKNTAFLRIYNVFNYDNTNRKRKNKKFYSISSMEKGYNKIAIALDIDRLARYSSLLCRRAYKSARCSYLRDLPDMYPATLHSEHIKLAMKVFRQQSIAPLQEYYCRQLYAELTQIWKAGGRQACDAVSLTGRPCCRPIHDGKNINLSAMKKNESAKFAEERHSKFGQDPQGHFSGFSSSHACNCGRTISKREDPFDLYDANISYFTGKCCQRVQWNYQLYVPQNTDKDLLKVNDKQQSHYNDGFNLCNHGGAELYHKQTGITQPGFDRYNCFLVRWDIPIPSNVYIFHQHYKQKNQRYRDALHFNKKNKYYKAAPHPHPHEQNDENLGLWLHKIRKTVSIANNKPNCNAYFPCFVGLEFECYRGHRAILDLHEISQPFHQNNPYEYQSKFEDDDKNNQQNMKEQKNTNQLRFVGTEFPTNNVPLRVPCKQCWNIQNNLKSGKNINIINGQLQRAFIVTPPPPISITAQPVIISALSDAIFEFDTAVVLPPSSFLVLRFPYIYFHDGRGLPPDKLSLSRGMLTVASHDHHQSVPNVGIHHTHKPHLLSKKIVIKQNEKR